MTRPLDAFIPVCWKFTHKRENWRACDMTHWLGILGSCAAHEELESPAPAAGLAFLEPVSNGEEAKNEVFVWRKRRRAADWEASACGWRIIITISTWVCTWWGCADGDEWLSVWRKSDPSDQTCTSGWCTRSVWPASCRQRCLQRTLERHPRANAAKPTGPDAVYISLT